VDGRKADDLALQEKKSVVAKSKQVKPRLNLAESCMGGYGPEWSVFDYDDDTSVYPRR
jgi:hypothetical protein